MADARTKFPLPEEPTELKAETRFLLEESPEEGTRVVNDARIVDDPLWEERGVEIEDSDLDYGRFLEISRGYANELRLWVFGERPWDHCAAGLAGRIWRRLPDKERALSEVSR